MKTSTALVVPAPSRYALIADGDGVNRAHLGEVLRQRGLGVLEAASGEEALAAVRDHLELLDLVVLELKLPGKDGFDVLVDIRTPTRQRSVPIVVVTGQGPDLAKCALELGADEAVLKGASDDEVGALIDLALANRAPPA